MTRRRLIVALLLYGPGPAGAAPPEPTATTKAPAPPLVTAYADVTLRWKAGKITVEKIVKDRFAAPTALRRYVGRFEAQVLATGKQVDALRFDFPLLADAEVGSQQAMADKLAAGLDARTTVRVPLPDGADLILVVDRRAAPGAGLGPPGSGAGLGPPGSGAGLGPPGSGALALAIDPATGKSAAGPPAPSPPKSH